MKNCRFNEAEPCHPVACLGRAVASYEGALTENDKLSVEACKQQKDILAVLNNIRLCAIGKVNMLTSLGKIYHVLK